MADDEPLLTTPLTRAHRMRGARMVAFAGYEMPVQFSLGVMGEHLHTREAAGLFDVSHMGQAELRPRDGAVETAALALERLIPVDAAGLKPGRQRYAMLLNERGGILDDFMLANLGDRLFLVVNAARKEADFARIGERLSDACALERLGDRALIALQGPKSEAALVAHAPEVAAMRFMDIRQIEIMDASCIVSRSGYTGEDGFEISVPADGAEALTETLLADDAVAPIGLGARDSLRLEAGLCLWGADIDETTSPIEAALGWAIQKARRGGGAREGGFPGAARILAEIEQGPRRRRVGLRPEGRAPVRAGAPLFAESEGGEAVGAVTSGGYGPSLGAPVAMGYVPAEMAAAATRLYAEVRGRRLPVAVAALPFAAPGYKRN